MKFVFLFFVFIFFGFVINSQALFPQNFSYKIDSIDRYPAMNILQLADLMPSANLDGNSIIVRGFLQKNFMRINNNDVSDPVYGGLGPAEPNQYPFPSIFAYDNIELTPAAFSAGNFNNNGAVLNLNLRKGNPKKFEVFAYYTGTLPQMYGLSDKDYSVINDNGSLKQVETSNRVYYQSSGDRSIDVGIGGPLLFDDNSSFFVAYRNYFRECNAGLEVYDPDDYNIGRLPNQRTLINNLTGSLNFNIINDINFELRGMYGISSWENSSWNQLYEYNISSVNNMTEREAKQNVENYKVSFLNLKIANQLTEDFTFKCELAFNNNAYESGRRRNYSLPDILNGFDIIKPQDKYTFGDSTYKPGANGYLDIYESSWIQTKTKDDFINIDAPIVNPLTGFYETRNISTDNPYGLPYFFISEGNAPTSNYFLTTKKFSSKLEIGIKNSLFGFDNELKVGNNFSFYIYDKYIVLINNADEQFFVNSEKYTPGGILSEKNYEASKQPVKPFFAGGFFEDMYYYHNFKFDIGLRADYFNSNYTRLTGLEAKEPEGSGLEKKDPKVYFSPRLNLLYKFNDYNNISLNYGSFFTMPDFNSLLNYNTERISLIQQLSNPYMEPLETSTIQLSYSGTFFSDLKINSSVYKNWYNNYLTLSYMAVTPLPYWYYNTNATGSTTGLDISISKKFYENINLSCNYSYSTTKTNTSIVNAPPLDPYTGLPTYPNAPYTSYYDIPHKLSLILNYHTGNNEGFEIFGLRPLQNVNLSFVSNLHSGFPYTLVNSRGQAISEYNSERLPTNVNFDLRATKRIYINSVSEKFYIAFTIDIFNLLNNSYKQIVNERTLLQYKLSDFPQEIYYENGDYSNPASYSLTQYDALGNRLYNKNADFNNDGKVTPAEIYKSYGRYVEDNLRLQKDMSPLRTAFFNISVGF